MKFLRANAPTLPLPHVQQIAREHFGLCGDAKALYSERDQNTLFREADGRAWMLKVANTDEDPGAIDCQIEALRHIQRVDPLLPVPRIRLSTGGQGTARVSASDGSAHIIYALSFLDGQIAGDLELAPALLRRIGALQARLGRAMRGFFHAAAGARSLLWDVRMAPQYLPFVDLLPAQQRSLVIEVLRQGIDTVLPRLDALRAQAIHGDLHAHNLILSAAGDLAGIIDFGDMIHGPLILDLSAALADFMVPASRIPQVLADMIRGYHEVTPLEADERALLLDLVELRLVITMLVNAYRHTQTPDEPNYAADAGFAGWETLETLQRLTRAKVETIIDSACGISLPHASVSVLRPADPCRAGR
jgi:Ser/Thr protein kinase RdoA (MazF antagonist)